MVDQFIYRICIQNVVIGVRHPSKKPVTINIDLLEVKSDNHYTMSGNEYPMGVTHFCHTTDSVVWRNERGLEQRDRSGEISDLESQHLSKLSGKLFSEKFSIKAHLLIHWPPRRIY